MNKFKPGDKVVRINCDFYKLKVGDKLTISCIDSSNQLNFEEVDGAYSQINFKLVEQKRRINF